jgi:hypothetical protein
MDQKQLKSLLKTLRENGVVEYNTPELTLKLDTQFLINKDKPQSLPIASEEAPVDNTWSNFPAGELSPDQLAFYSAGGDPSEDPENQN